MTRKTMQLVGRLLHTLAVGKRIELPTTEVQVEMMRDSCGLLLSSRHKILIKKHHKRSKVKAKAPKRTETATKVFLLSLQCAFA